MYLYFRPPTRTVIGTTRCPRGYMANVVGVKPIRWSTRLGMTELKKVSSTRCAEAVAGASRKAAMNRADQRINRVDHRVSPDAIELVAQRAGARSPATSLLRQPHRFEGFRVIPEVLHEEDLAFTEGDDDRHIHVQLGATTNAAPRLAPDDPVANIDQAGILENVAVPGRSKGLERAHDILP